MASGQDQFGYDVMKPEAAEFLTKIHHTISQYWRDEESARHIEMKNLYGCLQRLHSFLFISKQLAQEVFRLYATPVPPPGAMIFAASDAISIYFESLLFHGRAALDRLTAYVAPVHKQQNCDKFSKLRNVLHNDAQKDNRAQHALNIIDVVLPIFQGILLDTDMTKALRSALIHRCSLGELTITGFTFHRLPDERLLLFDQEIRYGVKHPVFPLIHSAWLLCQYVPFVILNILAIYLEQHAQLTLEACAPLWQNRCVVFSQFITPENSGIRFTVIKVLPGRFTLITETLSPDVLTLAYDVPSSVTSSMAEAGGKF